MQYICFTALMIVSVLVPASAFATRPEPNLTPGYLCTPQDPNFSGYSYPSKVARCNRNVNRGEKIRIAQEYGGIPESQWSQYEFDHLIPLCAGGSNDIRNLWPQPIAEAHEKDKVEDEVCIGLAAGTMTQQEAVQRIGEWINSH